MVIREDHLKRMLDMKYTLTTSSNYILDKPVFKEEGHSYINHKTGEQYISVTTLLHKFVPEKDWQEIATKYSKKNGKTPEYWIAEWKKINEEACEKGTAYHLVKQNEDLSQEIHIIKGRKLPLGEDTKSIEDLYQLKDGVYTELLIWNNFLGIAGQSDKVIIETINGVRYVDIIDYKTNKEIKDYNYIDRDGKKVINESLIYPLNKYCNSNYWIYQLQLNLYGWLLEQFGFTLRGGEFIHVTDNNKSYELLNLQSDIDQLVTHYTNAKRNSKSSSSKV